MKWRSVLPDYYRIVPTPRIHLLGDLLFRWRYRRRRIQCYQVAIEVRKRGSRKRNRHLKVYYSTIQFVQRFNLFNDSILTFINALHTSITIQRSLLFKMRFVPGTVLPVGSEMQSRSHCLVADLFTGTCQIVIATDLDQVDLAGTRPRTEGVVCRQ